MSKKLTREECKEILKTIPEKSPDNFCFYLIVEEIDNSYRYHYVTNIPSQYLINTFNEVLRQENQPELSDKIIINVKKND